MKKLIILAPAVALLASFLTSFTVHVPTPAVTSTTTTRETAVHSSPVAPTSTTQQTTTVRGGGH